MKQKRPDAADRQVCKMQETQARLRSVPLLAGLISGLVLLAGLPGAALAQDSSPAGQAGAGRSADSVAPYYTDAAFVRALAVHHHAPLAAAFRQHAAGLQQAAGRLCPAGATLGAEGTASALEQARRAWLDTANAWGGLEAVSVGEVVRRRTARQIDFRPVRPRLVLRMLERMTKEASVPDAAAMRRTGSATKGLAAIEWLLWAPEAPRTAAACVYLRAMIDEVAAEATLLDQAYAADAAHEWAGGDGEAGEPAAGAGVESAAQRSVMIVNQWLGGLDALRWRQLGKPLAVIETTAQAGTIDPHRDIWPRPPSASHRQSWQARWQSLKQVAIGKPPTDGRGVMPAVVPAVISLEALLRGLGRHDVADRWRQAILQADEAVTALVGEAAQPTLPPVAVMQQAVQALERVKLLVQDQVAPALSVTLGFSDADGD